MEELIEAYEKEDYINISCKKIIKCWKCICTVIYIISGVFLFYFIGNRYNYLFTILIFFALTSIAVISVYLICRKIAVKKLTEYLKKNRATGLELKNKKTDKEKFSIINKKINNMQKTWILKYCKKNNINSIEKIKIINEELNKKIEKREAKWLSFAIMGTLVLPIWDSIYSYLEAIEQPIIALLIEILILIVFTYFFILKIKSEILEYLEFLKIFETNSGLKRLQALLIYAAMNIK